MRILATAALLFAAPLVALADDYIEPRADETSRDLMDSRQTIMSVAVQGPIYPAKAFDPPCEERTYCNCFKICADLPPGKKFVSIAAESIELPGYARFVDVAEGQPVEISDVGDHQRVCRRLKIWHPLAWKEFSVTLNWK
jgi:hypothetical protein